MAQQYTILFDLDGTLVDTAPDLMRAHNHVMKKFGYPTKSTDEIRNCLLYTSPSPRDRQKSRMPSSA